MSYYIGLDLGGTNIKAGTVDNSGEVLSQVSVRTGAEEGPDAVMEAMAEAAGQVAAKASLSMTKISGIGIGAPGPLNYEAGLVERAPNMPGWTNIPLRDRIAEITSRPTVLENDANAAAFGEFWVGAGRDPAITDFIMLTLGTGIGSGIILGGKIVHGKFGHGAEGGHMIVQPHGRVCGCGQKGCLETYSSASRTGQRAVEMAQQTGDGPSSTLKRIYDRTGSISAKDVFDAAKAGDPLAVRVAEDTALYLGIACVNLCRLLDPQMIVFAGGMILAGQYLFDLVRHSFKQQTWELAPSSVQIEPAQLGNQAGFIGAAGIAWDAHTSGKLGR